MTSGANGSYASVNCLDMCYEVHGEGRPLVLLHGGMVAIDFTFGKMLPVLAKTRQVIAVEQQGHGHTADIDRPLSFEQMADDTAALLRGLHIMGADFFGYSDGGNVALGIAIRHPDLVRKVAIAGTNVNNDGLYPAVLESLQHVTADDMGALKDAYTRVAPHPGAWPVLVEKVIAQTLAFKGWDPDDLRAIKAPVLIIVGDYDIVRTEHAVELFRLIPNVNLAVLPRTDHFLRLQNPEWLLSMLADFFDAPMRG
jgi:pimeloyl-ACP methyl ester carboxylesterase